MLRCVCCAAYGGAEVDLERLLDGVAGIGIKDEELVEELYRLPTYPPSTHTPQSPTCIHLLAWCFQALLWAWGVAGGLVA